MEKRKILKLRGKEDKGIISLDLDGLNKVKNIHLAMDYLINSGIEAFYNNDLKEAMEISILSEKINGDYNDKRAINFKFRVLLKMEILDFNKEYNRISDKVKTFNKLKKIDNKIRMNFDLEFDDELMLLLSESEKLIISFREYIKEYIKISNIEKMELLELLYLSEDNNIEEKQLIEDIEETLRKEFKNINLKDKDSFKRIFKDKYDNNFYYSKELIEGYLTITNFENLKELLEKIDNFNLLYRFNNEEKLLEAEKKEILYKLAGENLINCSKINRDIIFKYINKKHNIFKVEDLKKEIDKLIELIESNRDRNALII